MKLAGATATGRFPLARLLQLIGLLQTGRCPNARRLAETCEVSTRTIYRDLASLSDAGLTVLYRPDRQGYELERHGFLQPPRLDEREALALLVLSRQWSEAGDLGLSSPAARAVDKVLQGLPEEHREQLVAASEILADSSRRPAVDPSRQTLHDDILAALVQRRQIRLRVLEPQVPIPGCTKFATYRMTPINGEWCLVGRSSLHCKVVVIPLSQIDQAELTADPYLIPPRFQLDRFLAIAHPSPVATPETTVVLRFAPEARSRASSTSWPGRPDWQQRADGGVELTSATEHPLELVPLLLSFGTDVEVVGPEGLRAALAEQASRIARHHARIAAPDGCSDPVEVGFPGLPLSVGG